MNMIVAVDENWAIGLKDELLVSIPADKKMMRNETFGKVIVVGRKSMKNFPQGLPLEGRKTIILSKDPDYTLKNTTVVHSKEELFEVLKDYDTRDVYVLGGASIYELLLPYTDTVHVTRIDHSYKADAYFPNLDRLPEWKITADSDEQYYFDLTYNFLKYERV